MAFVATEEISRLLPSYSTHCSRKFYRRINSYACFYSLDFRFRLPGKGGASTLLPCLLRGLPGKLRHWSRGRRGNSIVSGGQVRASEGLSQALLVRRDANVCWFVCLCVVR